MSTEDLLLPSWLYPRNLTYHLVVRIILYVSGGVIVGDHRSYHRWQRRQVVEVTSSTSLSKTLLLSPRKRKWSARRRSQTLRLWTNFGRRCPTRAGGETYASASERGIRFKPLLPSGLPTDRNVAEMATM